VAAGEIELVRDLLSGAPGAFDRFVEQYHSKLFRYTFLMCGQREDAEEVAQETLLRVFEKLEQLREPERMKSWIFRIARNVCYMKRRKSTYAPTQELSLDALMPAFRGEGDGKKLEIADWSPLPDAVAINSQLAGILHHTIEELPEIYRVVIVLRDIEELSTQETADILEISEQAVKTRLHRARLAVRQQLDAHLQKGATRT